jgi:PAS domain S-box-containing protein
LRKDVETQRNLLKAEIAVRKQVEAQLVASQAQLRAVIENEPECVKIVDQQGRLVQMNPAGLAMVEAESMGQVAGCQVLDLVAPEFRAAFTDLHRRVLAGESIQMEFEMLGLKGRRRWMETHAVPMEVDGRPVQLAVTRDVTERRQSRARLERVLSEQKAMLESDLVGIARVTNRIIRWANPAFEKMLGAGAGELVGSPTRLNYPSEAASRDFAAAAYAALATGKVYRAQIEFVRRDDGHIWVDVSGSMLNVESGESLWAFIDITAQKRASDSLRESEDKFRSLYNAMTEGVALHELVLDGSGRPEDYILLDVNPAFEAILGLRRESVVGCKASAVYGEVPFLDRYASVALTGTPCRFEAGSDSVNKSFSISAFSPARNQFATVFEDITQRKADEDQLRKLSQAVFQSPESIVITDLDARIEYVNEAFVRATGYGRDEVIGQNPRILHSGKTPPETYVAMWDALTQGLPWKGEFWNQRKDGGVYVEFSTIAPLRQGDGRITHYVAVKEDITDRKLIAEELALHRHHLE